MFRNKCWNGWKFNEYESVEQMQGSMSQMNTPNPEAFERAQYMKAITNFPVV